MGILDDAIKEHLELKRQHGADASELKQLEDEAFGAAERPGEEESAPDPPAEAPTEFMQQPEVEAPEAGSEEAPEVEEAPKAEAAPEVTEAPEPAAEHEPQEEPAEEESPAMEHEAVREVEAQGSEPPAPTGPTTEEREAISEQPTEMYDVEEELSAGDGDEEDFFDEKRLSDELDQALEAPAEVEAREEGDEEDEGNDAAGGNEEQPEDATEDVLEETPDFLEEDEDERLWFEQQPPKDFDFDD